MLNNDILPYFIAGGVGLLVGLERERSKARHGDAAPAGIRTFTLAALAGALAGSFGSMVMARSFRERPPSRCGGALWHSRRCHRGRALPPSTAQNQRET